MRDAQDLRRLGGTVTGQRQVGAVEALGDLHRAGEQDRHLDRPDALGDLSHHVQRGVVAGDVDRVGPRR
jgi:hypothetical protein